MIETAISTRLSNFAGRLKYVTWVVAGGLTTATLFALAVPARSGGVAARIEGPDSLATPILAVIVVGLVVFALQQLGAMLQRVQAGDIFGPRSVRCFKRFATSLLAASAIAVVAPWVIALGERVMGGARHVRLDLDASDALLILVSVLLLLVAHLLEAAAIFETDSRSFL